MFLSVYEISDIVEIPCDFGDLYCALIITQNLQNVAGSLGNMLNVAEAVLRKAQSTQGLIRPLNVDLDSGIIHNGFQS